MTIDHFADVSPDDRERADRIVELHELYAATFDPLAPDAGRALADEALRLAEEIGWSYGLYHGHSDVANCLRYAADLEGSHRHASQALALARSLADPSLVVPALFRSAQLHLAMSNHLAALASANEALAIASSDDDAVGVARAVYILSLASCGIGDYDNAVAHATRCLALARENGLWVEEAAALASLANVCDRKSDFAQAVRFLEASVEIYDAHGDEVSAARVYVSLGNNLLRTGELERAVEYAERGIRIGEKSGDRLVVANGTRALAATLMQQGELDRARAAFESCYDTFLKIGARDNAVGALSSLSDLERERGNLDDALHFAQLALATAIETGNGYQVIAGHVTMYEALKAMGDFAGALAHLEEYDRLQIELDADAADQRLQDAKARFEVEQAQSRAEIARLRAEGLQSQLDAKQRELTSTAMSLARQTELLGRFRNDLRQILRDGTEPKRIVHQFHEKLKELPCESIDWTKFEAEFQGTYPHFRAQLSEKYPELTKMEVRICSLVMVRLTTPDIASLLCLSERTVENHRLNIRRKMRLERGVELYDLLAELGLTRSSSQ
jgi:tetratricopeptide (TPR) repeat protein/DNA-binding CsgD family transcriptional regulator